MSRHELIGFCRERGASSVALMRAAPELMPDLQIGSWFSAGWQLRAARRLTHRLGPMRLSTTWGGGIRGLELSLEAAFWSGVRSAATARELDRLTRSSYVVLSYHQISGKPEDERLSLSPRLFAAQLRVLRRLRFHALGPDELLAFHSDPGTLLPRRSYVITSDDGFLDAVRALVAAEGHRSQLFAMTSLVGGRAPWAPDAPLAPWEELVGAATRGVAVGSHTKTHADLAGLPPERLEDELGGSLAELERRVPRAVPILAYPHGSHDAPSRHAAESAGYRAAYTTTPGRNGAGSDPFRLSRIGIKAWDGHLSFLWKVTTGQHLPKPWERIRVSLHRLGLTREARGRRVGA